MSPTDAPNTAVSDAERLLAPGVEVVLANGKIYHLKLNFPALAKVEDLHGSLDDWLEDLQPTQSRWRRKHAKAILHGMIAGLAHEGLPRPVVEELLDFKDRDLYMAALVRAWRQGSPEAEAPASGEGEGESDSPGQISTSKPPSATDAAMTSSAA